MNNIMHALRSALSFIISWLRGVFGDLVRLIFWLLRCLRKGARVAIAIALLTLVWLVVGAINRMYDFWDNDPDRGAAIASQDKFGDSVNRIEYLNQNWAPEDSLWFYNATQGSNLLPYDFFLALEQKDSSALFRDANNINRYGYLPQNKTFSNPDALPVGMTRDSYQGKDFMGFTCAACHTNQINYNGVGIRVDGAPAGSDMETFMVDLGAAMHDTLKNTEKRTRFVSAVKKLGDYSSEESIIADLEKYANRIISYTIINKPQSEDRPLTSYGYYRLDAFGRIFNRVLEHILSADQIDHILKTTLSPQKYAAVIEDIRPILTSKNRDHLIERIEGTLAEKLTADEILALRNKVFNPADAPVSYPFLWDTPQHDYVQWNGIVQNAGVGPLGRNAGQVIGVFGTLDWEEKPGFTFSSFLGGQGFGDSHIRFRSSIDMRNLRRVEDQLRKLTSPAWPEHILGELDPQRIEKGREIFGEYCQSCHEHVDPLDSQRRIVADMTHVDAVQTDKKMALNSVQFSGYSGILHNQYVGMGPGDILIERKAPVAALLTSATRNVITTPDPDKVFIRRWAERVFDILFTVGDNPVKPSLKKGNYEPDTDSQPTASLMAYKSRPLNGIWATAPYLHNGSVPTLYDLLLPKKPECHANAEKACTAAQGEYRPDEFVVGSRQFDPVRVGFKSEGYDGFVFKTDIPGNHNTGHEYAAGRTAQPNGEVLPALNKEQRLDLLEYLKSL